jgi:ribonuclease P protein component
VEEKEGFNETYMAAKAHSAQARTWLYEAHVDPQRSSRAQSSPRQGALETYSLVVALNRAVRLRKNNEFQRVKQQGRSIMSPLLMLAWMPNDVEKIRVGFVVSKRISKRAVDRNYLKRLLSEAMRGFLPRLPSGLDIVISARQKASAAKLRMLEQDMLSLLRKAQLLEA